MRSIILQASAIWGVIFGNIWHMSPTEVTGKSQTGFSAASQISCEATVWHKPSFPQTGICLSLILLRPFTPLSHINMHTCTNAHMHTLYPDKYQMPFALHCIPKLLCAICVLLNLIFLDYLYLYIVMLLWHPTTNFSW